MIGRREFMAGLSASAWPAVARTQQPSMPVIGFVDWGSARPNADFVVAFRKGLAEIGYVEGQNVAIEYRWGLGQSRRIPTLVADLVNRQVAVIVTASPNSAAHAAKTATSTIPIVFVYGGDPVNDGVVPSLSDPGGNATGIATFSTDLGGKRLSLVRALVPQVPAIAFLSGTSTYLHYEEQKSQILAAGRALECEVIVLEVGSERDYEKAFKTMIQRQVGALVLGAFVFRRTDTILALATRYKIPTMYPNRGFVVAGGLMSYGAKGLGLAIPETLLATADEVIE
jgi:putative ABC transport system substrate-binding protein